MSRNFSNASAPSTIKARASVGLCGVRGSYEGTVSSFWKIGGPVVGITVAVGLFVLPEIRKKLGQARIENEKQKSVIRKDEACENSRIKKDEVEQQCDLDIRKAKGLSQVKIDETRALFEIRREFGPMGKSTGQEQNPHEDVSLGEWLQWFNREFPMPCHSAIPHISTILDGCPEGFRPAMLFHLLGGYGALAFSNVRARYLDGRYHSPSLNPAIHIFLSPCTVGVLSEAMSLLLFSTSSIIVNFKKIEEYRLSNPLILLIIRKVWLYKINFRKNEKRKTINSERTLSFPVARP